MLTIVTGLPGACKTLYTLSELFKLYSDRQIYVHNFNGIDHEYFKTEPLDDPEKWFEVPPGAVVAIDEAQVLFPLRMAGSRVPEKCSKFETHRHDGHDVILITQDATLLDVHIRKLAGKHFHCKRLFGTESSTIFEYNKFESKPEDLNTIKKCISSNVWKFNKDTYDHYHSAEVHTVKRKIPFKLLVLPFLAVLSVVVFIFAGKILYNLANKDKELVQTIAAGGGSESETAAIAAKIPTTIEEWVADRTPLVAGIPWTAPMYAEVQDVVDFPKPHCIIFGMSEVDPMGSCRCYSQQMTRMEVNEFVCRELTSNGWFDPTLEVKEARGGSAPRDPRASSPVNRPERRERQLPQYLGTIKSHEVGQSLRPPPSSASSG